MKFPDTITSGQIAGALAELGLTAEAGINVRAIEIGAKAIRFTYLPEDENGLIVFDADEVAYDVTTVPIQRGTTHMEDVPELLTGGTD